MKINNLMSLALIISGFTIVNSAHAMLRQAMNRSGTKYITQLTQNTQRRFMETDGKRSLMDHPYLDSYENIPVRLRPAIGIAAGTACGVAGSTLDLIIGGIADSDPLPLFSRVGFLGGIPASFVIAGPLGAAGYVGTLITVGTLVK